MQYSVLNRLAADWKDVKSIVLYGTGTLFERNIKQLLKDFIVPFILDKDPDKDDRFFEGIPIYTCEQAAAQLKKYKIIVMTGRSSYEEIKTKLEEAGLEEYKDFCGIEQFIVEWNWKYKNRACLLQVNTAISTKCTLNCRNCNMFMPYYEERTYLTVEQLEDNIHLLFQSIDYIYNFILLGGEPFLNRDMDKILDLLYEKYNACIGRIVIVTNGTIVPKTETLERIRKYNIEVDISDYRNCVDYDRKFNRLVNELENKNINFKIKTALQWSDFGYPEKHKSFEPEAAAEHMKNCSPLFHGLNDGKFYYCHVSWSIEKCGRFQLSQEDFVVLDNSKETILAHSLGHMEKGFLSFCKVCGGCGSDNEEFVKPGIQCEK